MRQAKFLSVVCAGAFLCMGSTSLVLAQTPGGVPPSQSSPTSPTSPSTPQPGVNNPMGQNAPEPMMSKVDDKKFLKDAAIGGMTEVELGKLALQKSTNDGVKQFAQKMVDDHSKANDKLKSVASETSVDVPASLDSKHQSRIDKLSKLSGDQFDKAYVKDQLKDHQHDVKDFQAEAQNGTNPKVKAFASETLPTLQEHLELVKNLNKSEKNSEKASKGS